MKTVFLFLTILFSTRIGYAQGFLKTAGTKIVNAKGENVLLRGIGLGGWMLQEGYMLRVYREAQQHRIRARAEELIGPEKTQAFYDAWLKNHTTKADIDAMKAWGFNSVRLPMHFNLYTLPVDKEPVAGRHTWLEKGFAITDSLLAWCKANQMYLILDLHAAPGGQGNDLNISDRDGSKPSLWESEAHRQKTIALWRKLAERYKDEPWIAGYDVLNEPNWGFEDPQNDKNGLKEKGNVLLKQLMVDITKAIREVDQKHIIIIEGNGWGNNYNGILPPWDKNMVLSFHKYWNYNNEQSIAHILRFREQYQVPVWLGETGENSNVWFTEAIRLLETHNIGWAWWPLKKIGTNNPLEILMNEGYVAVIDYWNDPKKPKPSAEQAYRGLMELAGRTRFDMNVYHKDVIDAMIRQPFSRETKPFNANVVKGIGFISAAEYDLGINGEAYYDLDTANYRVSDPKKNAAGNKGRAYRNDGVDIDNDDSYFVSDIETGEWLQYTIDVVEKGTYKLQLLTSSDNANGRITLLLDGKKVGNELAVPKGGWLAHDAGSITLSKGKHKLRVLAGTGGFNLKELQFSK